MDNPDADLRYVVPERLVEASNGILSADGYDYEAGSNAMLLFLSTGDVVAALPFVTNLLENEVIYGNRLANAAKVGVSPDDEAESAGDFRVVYPDFEAGELMG
jgi:hypothetical protein